MKTCSIEGCDRRFLARGLCNAHWKRWRRHGDPSIRQSAANGEAIHYFLETVLNYDGDKCLRWPYATSPKGYGVVRMDGRSQRVSRLACEYEHGSPPSPIHQAAHSCGKGHEGCCAKRHLSWKTPKENSADMMVHGTHSRGDREAKMRLAVDKVINPDAPA